MEVSQAGSWFGVIMATGGAAGLVAGGMLADRMFGKGVRDAHLRVMRLSILLGGPPLLAAMLMPDAHAGVRHARARFPMLTMHGVGNRVALQFITPVERVSRPRLPRSISSSSTSSDWASGPMLMALLTDHLFGDDGALRYSIALVNRRRAAARGNHPHRRLPGLRAQPR